MKKVGEIVRDAIDLTERGFAEKAFATACLACCETIKKSVEKDELVLFDYKSFVDENWDLISFMCFPNAASPYLDLQFMIKEISMNPRRNYTLKEITVYLLTYAVKNRRIPTDIKFHNGIKFEKSDEKLFIPESLLRGLLGLIVVHPANKREQIPNKYWITIADFKMFVSELWGRKDIAERVRKFYLTR